jgi:hypothetical protein
MGLSAIGSRRSILGMRDKGTQRRRVVRDQRGWALFVVLFAAAVGVLVLSTVMVQSRRMQQMTTEEITKQQWSALQSRVQQLFQSVHLCSCNLRGLQLDLPPTGAPPDKVILPGSTERTQFGFFPLSVGVATPADPAPVNCGPVGLAPDNHVFEVTAGAPVKPGSHFRALEFSLRNFVERPANGPYRRFAAQLRLLAQPLSGSPITRSNLDDPIDVNVFVEVATPPPPSLPTIFRCYQPFVPPPQNGLCGVAQGQTLASAPTTGLCNAGTASAVTTNATTYDWLCQGINGGANANCQANRLVPVNGVCGPASGQTLASAPTTGLCNAGTASAVTTNATTYDWSCTGINGGANANCLASVAPSTPGVCTEFFCNGQPLSGALTCLPGWQRYCGSGGWACASPYLELYCLAPTPYPQCTNGECCLHPPGGNCLIN